MVFVLAVKVVEVGFVGGLVFELDGVVGVVVVGEFVC